jgi:hypothetical protein
MGGHHASAAVPAGVVVKAVAPLEHDGLGVSGVCGTRCRESTSHSRVEKNASAAALSKHDPTRPMDWRIPSLRHSAGERLRGVGRASVGVENDPLRLVVSPDRVLAAADRDGHRDRGAGQLRVPGAGRRGPQEPAGVQVDHGGQVQLPGRGRDLGDIADPALVDRARGEVPASIRSGNGAFDLSCLVNPLRRLIFRATTLAGASSRDRLLTDRPPLLAQVEHQPRRAVQPASASNPTFTARSMVSRRGPAWWTPVAMAVRGQPLVEPRDR